MKITSTFCCLLLAFNLCICQTEIHPYIQENYELDAKILTLRDIVSNPDDRDFDNPVIPQSRIDEFLEKLSVIYENEINSPIITEIFEDLDIHVNLEYNPIASEGNGIFVFVNDSPWLNDFIASGISGNSEFDNLISEYQLNLANTFSSSSCSCTGLKLTISEGFFNMFALANLFESIDGVVSAETTIPEIPLRFNYTGIPYAIYQSFPFDDEFEFAEACDILYDNNVFNFKLYGGDCWNGCFLDESRYVTLGLNNELISATLNNSDNLKELSFKFYPNPASNLIRFEGHGLSGASITILDVSGRQVSKGIIKNNVFNLGSIESGLFILKISKNDKMGIKKLIVR